MPINPNVRVAPGDPKGAAARDHQDTGQDGEQNTDPAQQHALPDPGTAIGFDLFARRNRFWNCICRAAANPPAYLTDAVDPLWLLPAAP